MNLIIDHGNTATKIYFFDNNQISKNYTILNSQVNEVLPQLIKEHAVEHAIYSGVGTGLEQILTDLKKKTDLIIFNHQTPIPIKNEYKTPQTLGTDRLAAAIGANYLFPGQNVVIFDIGTALTIDLVTDSGQYLGGNISPGPLMRLKALNYFTARLPLVELSDTQQFIGQSTHEAILNGVVWGIVNEINGYIETLERNFKNLRPIMTGGYAEFFAKKMKNPIFVYVNLVPIGLNRVLEFNKQKS